MKTVEELSKYNEDGTVFTREQILTEYNKRYKPNPTPLTHPELFDPFNPPEGWEYDAWHAIWWQPPTEGQYKAQLAFIWGCVIFVVLYVIFMRGIA